MLRVALIDSQRGLTLFLALIVLVAMMLSGIALFRTADSGIFVAGNIALQKSATRQGDFGTERVAARITDSCDVLQDAVGGNADDGYVADGLAHMPSASQGWADWWQTYAESRAVTMPEDSNTRNTVSYLVLRLCEGPGKPFVDTRCSGPPYPPCQSSQRSSLESCSPNLPPSIVHYLVINRVRGQNNTLSYVQTLMSCNGFKP